MRPRIILMDFISQLKEWKRSPGTMFWTFAFPILMMLIFGAIFSDMDDVSYDLYVQDLDGTGSSEQFLSGISQIDAVNIINISADENLDDYIEEHNCKAVLVIPEGFQAQAMQSVTDPNATVNLTLKLDPSQQSSNGVIWSIILNSANQMNLQLAQGSNVVGIQEESLMSENFEYIDFFMPAVIGITVMNSAVYGTIFRNTRYKKVGILRKLLTTPIKRSEWMVSKMLFMTFLGFVSSAAIIGTGIAVFDINVHINAFLFLIIVSAAFAFSGMALVLTRYITDEEIADSAAGALTFPMLFLAGTFFPLEGMPSYLQAIAKFLPLYYVNEGLRDAMIYSNWEGAVFNSMIVFVLAVVVFTLGVILTRWKDD